MDTMYRESNESKVKDQTNEDGAHRCHATAKQ